MAIHIDTESKGEQIRAARENKIKRSYRLVNIGCCAIMAAAVAASAASSIKSIKAASATAGEREALEQEYETIKANVERNRQLIEDYDNNDQGEGGTASGNTVVEKKMFSAQEAGTRAAELQTALYNNDILDTELEELKDLTGGTNLWFGSEASSSKSPIEWRFLTWYDHTEYTYDVAWGCYTADGKYLLYVQFGSYDGQKDAFNIGEAYSTTFGRMFLNNGSIERSGNSAGDDAERMMNELLENGAIPKTEQNQPTGLGSVGSGNAQVSENNAGSGGDVDGEQAESEYDPMDPGNVSEPGR